MNEIRRFSMTTTPEQRQVRRTMQHAPRLWRGSHLTPHSSTHTLSFDWAYPVGLMGGCLRLFMPKSQSVSRRIGWLRGIRIATYLIVVVHAQNISFYDIDRSRCLYWQLNNGPTAINLEGGPSTCRLVAATTNQVPPPHTLTPSQSAPKGTRRADARR